MPEEFKLTPWEVSGSVDYDRLMREFGIGPFSSFIEKIPKNILFSRGVVYGQRDFARIAEAIAQKKKFAMMTGLMPSGKFHLGHKVVADQIIYYQSLGAKIYLAVADVEAYNTRTPDLAELRKVAIEEYLLNYIALGLKPKNCDFYFQSARSTNGEKANAYYSLASTCARHVTFNEVGAIYGEITPGKLQAGLLQVADMLHPQLKEFEGSVPVVVPVGFDQDPHIRLARDISQRIKFGKFVQLSSTYHKFIVGLNGGKMSSSDSSSYIALTDSPKEAEEKIRKHAFSGGRVSVEEHRRLGGNPDVDVSFLYLKTLFEPDDKKLKKIYEDYKSGALLTGELKQILIEKLMKFLKEHQRKRELARKVVKRFLKE